LFLGTQLFVKVLINTLTNCQLDPVNICQTQYCQIWPGDSKGSFLVFKPSCHLLLSV